jgi:uncharacterized protein (TIGR02996 family)
VTTESALFTAICAHPDEDTPRLALADYLEETGTPANVDRAHFIRAQVELANLPPEDDDRDTCDRYTRLTLESERLFARNTKTWARRRNTPRRPPLTELRYGWWFRRGFQEFPFAHVDHFLPLGEELFRHHPVSGLTAESVTAPQLKALLRLPWLGRVRSLWLCGQDEPDWSPVFRADALARLPSLNLSDGTFARSAPPGRGLDGLRELRVARLPPAAGRVKRLLNALPHDRLETLDIGYARWTAADLLELAESEKLANLRRIYAGVSDGTPADFERYTATKLWRRSPTASLTWMSGEKAAHLPSAPPSPGLRVVRFAATSRTTLAEMRAIAASPLLRTVTRLDFLGAWSGADKLEALLASPHLGNLAALDLSHCELGPEGARLLADSPVSDGLVRLNLGYCRVRQDGAKALLASPRFGRLRQLSLAGNSLRPAMVAQLRERFGDGVSA